MLIRRQHAAPVPAAVAPAQGVGTGTLMMRRIELKSSSKVPYWYVEARSDHDAIIKLVNGSRPRGDPKLFHVVSRYVHPQP